MAEEVVVAKSRAIGDPTPGSTKVVVGVKGKLGGANYNLVFDSDEIKKQGFTIDLDYTQDRDNAPKLTSANFTTMLEKFGAPPLDDEIKGYIDSEISIYRLKYAAKSKELRIEVEVRFGSTFILNKLGPDIATVDSVSIKIDKEPIVVQ